MTIKRDTTGCMEAGVTGEEINVLAMIKGEERYIFVYNDQNRVEMLRTLGRYAADPELSFTWFDAAVMSKKVREMAYHQQLAQVHSSGSFENPSSSHRRFSFDDHEGLV